MRPRTQSALTPIGYFRVPDLYSVNASFPRSRIVPRPRPVRLALLASRLAQRHNRGYALHVLVLSCCFNLVATDIALLREVVNTLHWDGNEHVGDTAVWLEEVPYGVRYPWEGVGDPISNVIEDEDL